MAKKRYITTFILLLLSFCVKNDLVVEVVDGDTFRTERGEKVRLLGINTPESGEPGADIARDILVALVQGKEVRLERDITDHDDYDRSLRYVYVGGVCVNAEMVRMGYAETRFFPPDTSRKEEFEILENNAIRNKQGLWGFSVFQVPDTTRTKITTASTPEATVDVISWRDAAYHYGQSKVVEGTIVATHNTGKVCYLNFHTNWRKYFTAVIFASDFGSFPRHPEDYYLKKKVRITGLIKEYKGKPEIIIKSPSQIEIVE